tara:strand:- start:34525 stop:34734 length:210 start_codon:yes stop_codon:yes gene_type:complete
MDLYNTLQKMDFDTADMFYKLQEVEKPNGAIKEIIKDLQAVNQKINKEVSKIRLAPYRIKNNNHIKQSA